MTSRILLSTLLISCFFSTNLFAQRDTIKLTNSSFEDMPRKGRAPSAWIDCGFPNESPPDIQPSFDSLDLFFYNNKKPYKGQTYLAMVARSNDTWERVGQRLLSPIERGKCYQMSMYLAQAKSYISPGRLTPEQMNRGVTAKNVNHNQPIKVRIYGGNDYCSKKELLGESKLIDSHDWEKFEFTFKTIQNYTYITIEAYYKTPSLFPYNGNILIDELSDIIPIHCPDEPYEPLVKISDPAKNGLKVEGDFYKIKARLEYIESKSDITFKVNGKKMSRFSFDTQSGRFSAGISLKEGDNTISIEAKNKEGKAEDKINIISVTATSIVDVPKSYEDPKSQNDPIPSPTIIPELANADRLEKGQNIRVNKLFFPADSFQINMDAYPVLDEIYYFLQNNSKIVVEIGGHTNDRCEDSYCKMLSEKRAKSVTEYLANKGIPRSRLKFRGYGKEKPLVSNKTSNGRRKNQRVQIKILSLNG